MSEGLIEGHEASAHIIDVFPFSPVRPVADPDFIACASWLEPGDGGFGLQQVEMISAFVLVPTNAAAISSIKGFDTCGNVVLLH